jgi:hypothetical protein
MNNQIIKLYKNVSILLWYTPYTMKDYESKTSLKNAKIKVAKTTDIDVPYLAPPDLQDSTIKKTMTQGTINNSPQIDRLAGIKRPKGRKPSSDINSQIVIDLQAAEDLVGLLDEL